MKNFNYSHLMVKIIIRLFKFLQNLGIPHIDSFNFIVDEGLNLAVTDLLPVEFDTKGNYRVKLIIVVIH